MEFLTVDLHDAKVDLYFTISVISNRLLWDVPLGDIPAMSMILAIDIWILFCQILCYASLN